MSTPILQVTELSVAFGNSPTVNNISFDVLPGELLAVVGESGSGKSVTALSLLQLLPTQAAIKGKLLFAKPGQAPVNLLKLPKKNMQAIRGKDIAMIFQEPMTSLNPVLTCGKQVMEAIQLHQQVNTTQARQKTIELFEQVKLPQPEKMIHRYPHQLSGGQKQRVMIAMAMSGNPALLIADEPTTALDVTVQKNILGLIKQLQHQHGMSVLLITHDLGLVADMADRVVVMHQGNIVEQGNAQQILKHPQQQYTRALLQCRPALHAKGQRLPVIDEKPASSNQDSNKLISLKEQQHSPSIDTKPLLIVDDVKVYYKSRPSFLKKTPEPYKAVDGVSFTVSKGETLGLVGESGCGKTTLGRAILQLVPVTSGQIILNGKNLLHLPKNEISSARKDLQIVFQDPYSSLNPRITIGDAIAEPLQVHQVYSTHRQRKDKVIELLEKVHLKASHFGRYPHQFSGGQRQRICIARALALQPSFLIFDESVSALDVSVQAQILNLMNELKQEMGFTSIFISHDLSVVRYISDRIMVMHQGKIVEEGDANDIYFSPRHPYTKMLMDAVPGRQLNRQ